MNAENCSVEDFAQWAKPQLEQAQLYFGHGCEDAEDEAFWLASYIAEFDYGDFEDGWDRTLNPQQISLGKQLLAQRIETQKPLAYLINQIWFAGHRFYIDERALIPRSHLGEWIPEQFEPWVDSSKVNSILDLCCGGGSIGLAAALYLPDSTLTLADLSVEALQVAAKNIENLELTNRASTVHSDLFTDVNGRFDLILCNPPYVSDANMQKLPQEYRYEPEMALVAGPKGLDSIAIILAEAENYLTEHGFLVLEAGTAAPALDEAMGDATLNWMMSASGESVVLIISRIELQNYRQKIAQLLR